MNLYFAGEEQTCTMILCPRNQSRRRHRPDAVTSVECRCSALKQRYDKASDTVRINRAAMSRGKRPVTRLKWHTKPKLRKQHVYTMPDDEQVRIVQSFGFVQKNQPRPYFKRSSTRRIEKNCFLVRQINLSTAFCQISSCYRFCRASFRTPINVPRVSSKASLNIFWTTKFSRELQRSLDKQATNMKKTDIKLYLWNICSHVATQKHQVVQLGKPRLSTGLNNLNWFKVEDTIMKSFQNWPITIIRNWITKEPFLTKDRNQSI